MSYISQKFIDSTVHDWNSTDTKDRICLALSFACLISGFALGFLTAWGWA